MRQIPVLVLAIGSFAAVAAAQTTFSTTPLGMTNREGASLFAMPNNTRYQAIDQTQAIRVVKNINAIAFRRDGRTPARASGGSVNIGFRIGLGLALENLSGDPDKNWVGKPSTVFNKRVSFPSWTIVPVSPPARFDFVIPFTSSYLFNGALPLAREMTWTNYTTRNGRSMAQNFDTGMRKNVVVDAGTTLGTGCGSFTTRPEFLTAGPAGKNVGMSVNVSGVGGPAGSPVLWSIDLKDSNITVPGWCAKVHALPNVLIPLGKIDAQGGIGLQAFAFPYNQSVEGVSIYSQLVSSDANGIVLAQARKNTIPKSTTNNEAFQTAEIWHATAGKSANRVIHGGSIVGRLRH